MAGLNIDNLVDVTVTLSPLAAAQRNFGILLIVGDSDVINGEQRIREYLSIEEVAADFGTTAPEYDAALLFFSQNPQPRELFIGRWLRTPTAAILQGGILTVSEQLMTNWTPILDGTFSISFDGVNEDITGLDFSLETNLNGVASVIDAALVGGSIIWDGTRFIATSATTGISSTVSFASPEGTGTDISAQLRLTAATSAQIIAGFDAETPLEATVILAQNSGWYAETFAASVTLSNAEYVEVADFIQASSESRIFCITESDTGALDSGYSGDIGSILLPGDYTRVALQYSQTPFAVCSFFGRAATVDFEANNSTITMMYKNEPIVTPELITTTQANTLETKRYNVFVTYSNEEAIIQYGVMSGQAYFDEIHGLDWFKDALQEALFNLLFTSATKIPQTEAGQSQLVTECASVCNRAVSNGLVGPGVWNEDGFGTLKRGDTLTSGYYIFTESINLQPQAIRDTRTAPLIQIAVKLAGAIHKINIAVVANR